MKENNIYIDSIKYIPTCLFNSKKFYDKNKISSYKDARKRIVMVMVPRFYLFVILTVLSVFAFALLAFVFGFLAICAGIGALNAMSVLNQIKMITCECGHLIELDDNIRHRTIEEDYKPIIVEMSCICQNCNNDKNVKFDSGITKRPKMSTINNDEEINDDFDNEIVEDFINTKKAIERGHKKGNYQFTVEYKIESLFANKGCGIKEIIN